MSGFNFKERFGALGDGFNSLFKPVGKTNGIGREKLEQIFKDEVKTAACLFNVAAALEQADQAASELGSILWIDDKGQAADSFGFDIFRVRVLASTANPALIDKIGYAFKDTETDTYNVVFADGGYGLFQLVTEKSDDVLESVVLAPPEFRLAVVDYAGRLIEVAIPDNLSVIEGDKIRLTREGKFNGIAKWSDGSGDIAVIEEILSNNRYVVSIGDTLKKIAVAAKSVGVLEVGHRVVLDTLGRLILRNLGQSDIGFHFTKEPDVAWGDVIGQNKAIETLRQVIEFPAQHPEVVKALNMKSAKGAIMIGPPGCGKSLLGKAAATAIRKIHGTDTYLNCFFFVKAPEFLASLVGQGEALIRHLFDRANNFYKKYGIRPIIFIDEFDAVGKVRGSGISSDATDSLVNTLLIEIEETDAFVLTATNRQKMIDPALLRPGRLTFKIPVERPNQEATKRMFELYLKDVRLDETDIDTLSKKAAEEIFSDRYPLYSISVQTVEKSEEFKFGLQHLISGDMINSGIIEQAKIIAANRCVKDNCPAALSLSDIIEAIKIKWQEEFLFDHTDALNEVSEKYDSNANISATRLYQGKSNR